TLYEPENAAGNVSCRTHRPAAPRGRGTFRCHLAVKRRCSMNRNHRSGFTLIELLVAIAIIAVLLAITLPAVQQIRQAAKRAHCQKHLRQMGVALAGFESTWGTLPAGRDGRNGWHHSWATAVLPHLEQPKLYDQYDYQRAWDDVANQPVVSENLAVFRC